MRASAAALNRRVRRSRESTWRSGVHWGRKPLYLATFVGAIQRRPAPEILVRGPGLASRVELRFAPAFAGLTSWAEICLLISGTSHTYARARP